MKSQRKKSRRSQGRSRPRERREWVGGRLSPPFFSEDREEPYRTDLVVWMENPEGTLVGLEAMASGETEGALGQVLLTAMARPLSGSPRRPEAIRVASASLATEVRAAIGGAIPITVAPTPELDILLDSLLESMPGGSEDDESVSYLEGGRIPAEEMEELFTVARIIYRLAPWKVATDDQVLRLDMPELDVVGACLSIIGNLGESLGLLIFPSRSGYESFQRAGLTSLLPGEPLDLGTGWLALNFERGADLPASMRREVAEHGWPVAGAEAYPRVQRFDPDGVPRPLVLRDLRIATACASAFGAFFAKHRERFESDTFEPVSESYLDEDDLEVRFTLPYEAFELFDVRAEQKPRQARQDRGRRPKLGRNDPCWCGSGRKYKKCHLPLDEAEASATPGSHPLHELDRRLFDDLVDFARTRPDAGWRGRLKDFADVSQTLDLAVPWSLYHCKVDGATMLERYLEERGRRLAPSERQWLLAQQAAWLSVWEVTGIRPGESLLLRDMLSHETRLVHEVTASQDLVVHDAILARVVDHEGVSLLCGLHPRPLPPMEAAEVVRRARGRLRRRRAVPVERLRDEAFGSYLIRRWEEAVAEMEWRAATPPMMHNTDGEPLLLTTDHFEIAPGSGPAVAARLAAMEDVSDDSEGGEPPLFTFLRPGNPVHKSWDNTVIGHARLIGTTLHLDTNSLARADALRARVEAACGELIRHKVREHVDPRARMGSGERVEQPPDPETPEIREFLAEYKRRHYADWIDQPLPALDGETPREAVQTAEGRTAVDLLLKDMQNLECRWEGDGAFDFSEIRKKLNLE